LLSLAYLPCFLSSFPPSLVLSFASLVLLFFCSFT
jgi:hypothetical protein